MGLTLPWLGYFSLGPSPSVLQSLTCGAALCVLVAITAYEQRDSWLDVTHVIALSWLAAASLSCVMALLQYFDLTAAFQPWVSASKGEAFANLRQRNQFAVLCLVGLAAWRWLSLKAPVGSNWRPVLLGAWVLLIMGNAASQSRTGMLGLALLVIAGAVWRSSDKSAQRLLIWASLPTYALSAFLLPILSGHSGHGWGALSRFTEEDSQCQSRLTLWSNVLHLIQQKPLTGWGWGELDFAHYASLYPGERFCAILDNAHNLPLHLAVELGVPLAILICIALVGVIWRQRPWAEVDTTRQMAWTVLVVIGLHSLLEYPLWYGPFQMTLVLCVALLWRRPALDDASDGLNEQENSLFRQYSIQFIAIIVGVFLLYASWDYHRISQIYLAPQDRSAAYADKTLAKIQASWLFKPQVRFAEIAITPLTQANADQQLQLALGLLHFSPEPRVIERVLDAALVLHRDDLLAFHLPRYQAAFSDAYATWQQKAMPQPQSSPTSRHVSPVASHP